jgi:hypothetical protein
MSLKINLAFEKPVFKIEIVNLYDSTIRLWSLNYLPGYNSIYFKIATDTNRECSIRRKPTRWTVNVLDFFEINPGQSKQIDLNINDGTWDLSELMLEKPDAKIVVSCILSIEPDEDAIQYNILTGRYESEKISLDSVSDVLT